MANKQPSRLRALIVFLTGLYVLALALYIVLRLARADAWWLALLHNGPVYFFVPIIVLLPLAFVLRMPRLVGWLTLLAVIGVIWFAPLFLPKNLPVLPDNYLTLISFNVFPYNERLPDVERWLLLKNADVVLLQEVDGQKLPEAMPGLLTAYPHQRIQPDYNGATVLSRYPILAGSDLRLGDAENNQQMVIEYGDSHLTLFNIHLEMPIGAAPQLNLPLIPGFILSYDETLRNRQIAELLVQLDETNAPYLVAGDFNMSEFSFIYQDLNAVMGDVFRQTNTGIGATFPGGASEEMSDMFAPLFRLDYVWHSAGIRPLYSEIGPRLGSDHLPLFVAVEVMADNG